MKKKIKKIITYSIIGLLFGGIIVFRLTRKPVKKTKKFETKAIPVEVARVKNNDIKERIFLTGEIRGIQEVKIFSFVTGILRRKFVVQGQRVGRGQALFTIDQTQRGADMLDHVVRSPINGIITDIQNDIGDQIIANQTSIARVVQTHQLKVKVYVGMIDVSKVKIGNVVIIKVATYEGKEFRGIVNKISPTIDPVNRTVEVEVIIDNRAGKLKSGMFAEVEIITEVKKNKYMVPQQSVIFEDNLNYVYKYNKSDNTVVRQKITVGNNYSGLIEVKSGLKTGQLILVKGQYNVFSGSKVLVSNTEMLKNKESKKKSSANKKLKKTKK